nr:MAG TPA: hypothetical protein [Caudoviricetes sp.]
MRPPALLRPSLRAAIERVARAPFDGVALWIVTGRRASVGVSRCASARPFAWGVENFSEKR